MEALSIIFALLFLLSGVLLLVSLVLPGFVNRLIRKGYTRKRLGGLFSAATVTLLILTGITAPPIEPLEEVAFEQQESSAVVDNSDTDHGSQDTEENLVDRIDSEDIDTVEESESNPDTVLVTTEPGGAEDTNSESTETEDNNSYHRVVRVVDGDTIRVNVNGTEEIVRLIGIDTPELVDTRRPVECFAQEASQKANALLANRMVRLESDPTQDTRDVFGRLLAYAYRDDGLFFNQHMIETGYAFEYTYRTPYQFQQEFKTAEQNARTNNLGLWSPDTCAGDVSTGTVERGQGPEGAPAGNYYTSSHHSSRYYYPRACNAWHGLAASNLRAFDTLEELQDSYNRTLSPQCE